MSSESMQAIEDEIRIRLLTFEPLTVASPTLAELVGVSSDYAGSDGNVFWNQVPSDLDKDALWITLRLIDALPGGADGGMLQDPVIEFRAFGHGRHRQSEVDELVDIAHQAWWNWIGDTVIARHPYGRRIISYDSADNPGDRELVSTLVYLPFTVAPQFLTQYINP
jgi:hypothetical protein